MFLSDKFLLIHVSFGFYLGDYFIIWRFNEFAPVLKFQLLLKKQKTKKKQQSNWKTNFHALLCYSLKNVSHSERPIQGPASTPGKYSGNHAFRQEWMEFEEMEYHFEVDR